MTSMPPLTPKDSVPSAIQTLAFIPDSDEALTDELTHLAGHINAAQYRFLKLLAALIERNAWGGGNGIKTPAHWLNYYCGIDLGAAREKVRVAKALASLPRIEAAFASGAISYSKVRAMTRSATAENEALLLNVAKHGTAQHVETLVRQHRRVQRLNRDDKTSGEQSQHQNRELSWHFDEDGMLVLRGRFAPEEGAVLVKALEAALNAIEQENAQEQKASEQDQLRASRQIADVSAEMSQQDEADVSAETRMERKVDDGAAHEPATAFAHKRADALARLAEHFLVSGHQSHAPLGNGDKYQVLIHLDARRNNAYVHPGMPAHLDDGPPLTDSTVKRLACDASLVPVLRDDAGNVLNIGRKSRTVPPAIRRALKIRDGSCRFPGCCQSRAVDAHHIQHWCDGGETSLENLVLLCRHHHRLLHEGVFSIHKGSAGSGTLIFRDQQGKLIKPALYPQFQSRQGGRGGSGCSTGIERDNTMHGLEIDARTAVTHWRGERMDYGLAIDALMRNSLGTP